MFFPLFLLYLLICIRFYYKLHSKYLIFTVSLILLSLLLHFLFSIGVLLSNTKKVYHHFDATFKSFSTFFASMLLQFSASLEAASDVDFMRNKDIFSFTGNTEPGIPCDGLDINLPSYHMVCDNLFKIVVNV